MLAKKHCDGMCSAVCRSTREIGGANIHKGVQDKNETRFDRREFGVAGEWRGKSGNEEGGGGSNSQRTQAEKTLFPLSGDRPHLLAGFRDSADRGVGGTHLARRASRRRNRRTATTAEPRQMPPGRCQGLRPGPAGTGRGRKGWSPRLNGTRPRSSPQTGRD